MRSDELTMEPKPLFVNTCYDLKEKLDNPTEYNLTKASGLLRLLLIDRHPLADLVAKETGKKIKFCVRDSDLNLHKVIASTFFEFESIDPEEFPNSKKLFLEKNDFLSHRAFSSGDSQYSIKQIIKFFANKEGGIHSDACLKNDPDFPAIKCLKNEIENKTAIIRQLGINTPDIGLSHSFVSIGRVTLRSLNPILSELRRPIY